MNIWAVSKAFFEDRLPNRYKYYSSLKNECISDKGYLHALGVSNNVWEEKMYNYHVSQEKLYY